MRHFTLGFTTLVLIAASSAQAQNATGGKKAAKPKSAPAAVSPDAPNAEPGRAQDYQVVTSTKFDFDAANIDGRMKAPMGFMLQGRKSHSQVNMVELRTNFRNELLDSKSAVMAIPAPLP
jgi:hypothetical protein